MSQQRPPSLKQVVIDVLTFLHYQIAGVRTFEHPAIDDFSQVERASWEHWLALERRGGYVQWPRRQPLTEIQMIRLVAFVELVADHPAHAWLHDTLKAFAQYGPYIPSTQEDETTWTIHPEQHRYNLPQATLLRTLHGLLSTTEELALLPNKDQLLAELLAYVRLDQLILQALVDRKREIENEIAGRGRDQTGV